MAVPNQPPENLQISFYLYKNYDLWIWDFDDTLIDTTTYYIKSMEREDILNRKLSELDHGNLLNNIFQFLRNDGVIPDGWLHDQVRRLDRIEGDIDVLSKRLAFIRTWTFVSYKRSWTKNCLYWQAETRRVEDKLSDELHRKLTQRFVDRRTSVLVKGLKQRETLVAEINQNSEIFVENQLIGKLVGFCFEKDKSASDEENKALRLTAHAVLGPQYKLRSDKLYNSSDEVFSWDSASSRGFLREVDLNLQD